MINKSIVLFVPNGLTFCKNSVIVKYTDEFNDPMRTQKSIRYYLNGGYPCNKSTSNGHKVAKADG